MTEATEKSFDEWARVELMGHQTLVGRVSEYQLAGSAFIRIDVPEVEGTPAFTKLVTAQAIYGITPVTEEVARRLLARIGSQEPITPYALGSDIAEGLRLLERQKREQAVSAAAPTPAGSTTSDDEEEEDDDDAY